MIHKRFILTITLGALLFMVGQVSRARAQIIIQTETLGSTPADFNGVSLSPPIAKFSTALGTLTEVDITWAVSGSVGGTIENLGTGPQTFTLNNDTSVNLSEQSNGAGSLANPNLHTQQPFTNLAANAPTAYGPFTPTNSTTNNYTDAATKAFFTGPGTVDLFATATSTLTIVGGSNIQTFLSDSISGTATITYKYRPIATSTPEPGSIAFLAGLGITGSLFAVRHRRKS